MTCPQSSLRLFARDIFAPRRKMAPARTMRKLQRFDDPRPARVLREALRSEDIASELRVEQDGAHTLWVLVEEQVPAANQLLAAFVANPDAPEFDAARRVVNARDKQQATPRPSAPPNVAPPPPPVRIRVTLRARASGAPVTLALLIGSAAVAIATDLGTHEGAVRHFTIASFNAIGGFHGYDDVRHGELWRLFTPILLHFGFLHLIFNSFWLLDLGGVIERFQGSRQFAGFVLLCALVSNVAQLQLGGSPLFGGLSGIIYALVGYLWARGRFDPLSPIGAPRQLMTFFIVWLVLGFTGVLGGVAGPVANYCHLGGLLAGAVYGYVAARLARAPLRG